MPPTVQARRRRARSERSERSQIELARLLGGVERALHALGLRVLPDPLAQELALLLGLELRLLYGGPVDHSLPERIDHVRARELAAITRSERERPKLAQVEPQRVAESIQLEQ